MRRLSKAPFLSALLLIATQCDAASLNLSLTVPTINATEYHRPYIAVWIERPDASVAANLAVWYQQTATREGDGTKWLADLRQWWRRSGRQQTYPIDGVSGATRPAGMHQLRFKSQTEPLKSLAAGNYRLVVEAAREVGGRELLKLDFTWPPTTTKQKSIQGKTELGAIQLDLLP